MELSLEELYVPEQASLSVFPWLIGIEEAKEILKKDGVLEGDYEVIDSGDIATITVHKVKLKEFSLPMDFSLIFQKDFYLTNQSGFVLSGYGFVVNEIDGVKVPPARELWGKTENKALKNYEEERQKWLKKADQKIWENPIMTCLAICKKRMEVTWAFSMRFRDMMRKYQ